MRWPKCSISCVIYFFIFFSQCRISCLCILTHSVFKVNNKCSSAGDTVTWHTAVKLPVFGLPHQSLSSVRSQQPTCCLKRQQCSAVCFGDFTVIVPAAVYAFAVVNPLNMYFPCKCFWRWHRLPEHGRLTCRTSNFSACHGGSPSGHRYAQRDLLIGGC